MVDALVYFLGLDYTVFIVIKANDWHVQKQRPCEHLGQVFVGHLFLTHGHHKMVGCLGQSVLGVRVCGPVVQRVQLSELYLVDQPRVERVYKVCENQQRVERELHHGRRVVHN